jgi:hypothetical protein
LSTLTKIGAESLVVLKTMVIRAVLLGWSKGLYGSVQEMLEQTVHSHLRFNNALSFLPSRFVSGWGFGIHNAVKNVGSLVESAKESIGILLSVYVKTRLSYKLLEFSNVGVDIHLTEFEFVELLAGHLLACGIGELLLETLKK